jgi:GNAT superfamily N-acetyltransferase
MFRQYHYLSGSIAKGSRCYVAVYQDKPVGFIAVMHIHMKSRYFRVHRLVVLPDYQGIGLGKRLLNFIAELYTSQTKAPFYIVTSNPQIVRGNLDRWNVKRCGHVKRSGEDTRMNSEIKSSVSAKRISITLEYKPVRGNKTCF